MGKRASNGSSTTTASSKKAKVKGGKSSEELSDLVEKEKEVIESLPWWSDVMDDVDQTLTEYGGVTEFLLHTYPDEDSRKEFSTKLINMFPVPEGEQLSNDFGPGIKNFSLFQVCYHSQAGNKGLVIRDYMKNLVSLVLLQGAKTDASTCAGVEFPVLQPLCHEFFETKWQTEQLQPQGVDTFESQSIAFTKGWTRGCAFVFVGYLLMKHNLVDFYKEKLPKQFRSLCLLKGLVSTEYHNEADRIQANRGFLAKKLADCENCFISFLGSPKNQKKIAKPNKMSQ